MIFSIHCLRYSGARRLQTKSMLWEPKIFSNWYSQSTIALLRQLMSLPLPVNRMLLCSDGHRRSKCSSLSPFRLMKMSLKDQLRTKALRQSHLLQKALCQGRNQHLRQCLTSITIGRTGIASSTSYPIQKIQVTECGAMPAPSKEIASIVSFELSLYTDS